MLSTYVEFVNMIFSDKEVRLDFKARGEGGEE